MKTRDISDPRDREIFRGEVVAFIREAVQREGAFPIPAPADGMSGDGHYLVRDGDHWMIVWYVAHRGGALPAQRYERRFSNFEAALAEFVGDYLPREDRRVRCGAVFIVPDRQ